MNSLLISLYTLFTVLPIYYGIIHIIIITDVKKGDYMSLILNEKVAIEPGNMEVFIRKLERALATLCKTEHLLDGTFRINDRYPDDVEKYGYKIDIFEESYPSFESHMIGSYAPASVCFIETDKTKKYSGCISITVSQELLDEVGRISFAIGETGTVQKLFRIPIERIDETIDFISQCCKERISVYESSNTFGCCSRYKECSLQRKCIHENPLYSTGCAYRKNLENGKIFY